MEASDFKRLNDVDHVLLRPQMFIGDIGNTATTAWLLNQATMKAERTTLTYPPALEHLCTEVVSNAYDNVSRSRSKGVDPGRVEQTITETTVSVYNEGVGIPVIMHPTEKMMVPELIFFVLRTSSNYDDKAERTWCGLNGYGVKLVACLSKWFEVEITDPINHLHYKQRCEQNLSQLHKPIITPYTGATASVRVTYEADFARFGVTGYNPELIRLFAYHAASASFTKKVPITFNGALLDLCAIEKYSALFTDKIENHLIYKDDKVELCLLDMPENGFTVSFVNGMPTRKGGAHVNDTLKLFTSTTLERLNKKKKLFDVRDVKKHLALIIACTVVNPVFTTQSKEELARPSPKIDLPEAMLRKVEKWSFVKQMSLYADIRLQGGSEKDKKKREKHVVIADFEDANEAGGVMSPQCTLILTEGLSAKTFAMRYRGMVHKGTDLIGVLPLRGKGLNVLNGTAEQLLGNKEIIAIREAVGIRPGVDYSVEENFKLLRYGRVLYATDSDADGDHIKGLGLNLFGFSAPSLLKQGFIGGLLTPLLKAVSGSGSKAVSKYFLTKDTFHEWFEPLSPAERKKWKIGYYKGLGRWEKHEFTDISKFVEVDYVFDEAADRSLKLAFERTMAGERKLWVSDAKKLVPIYQQVAGKTSQTISNFIHACLRRFSQEHNERSLASVTDGFKSSQRKIFFATRKKGLSDREVKVAQFAGYVAENTAYEHGEGNVEGAIMNMCQDYPGANNIPLISGRGEYGTRLAGGKDAADGRYVFMSKAPLVDLIFRREDDVLLDYLEIDGDSAEPRNYIPIICMAAVNGGKGIGTGFSWELAPRDPKQVLAFQRAWLTNHYPLVDEEPVEYPRVLPWFRGFKGKVLHDGGLKYTTEGVLTLTGEYARITELPINVWTNDYSTFVDKLLEERRLKEKPRKDSKPEFVDFTLRGFHNPTLRTLRLTSSFSDTNIVFYDEQGYIVKYDDISSLLHDFCSYRYKMYEKRRELLYREYQTQREQEQVKIVFIDEVIAQPPTLSLNAADVLVTMEQRGYPLSLLELSLKSMTADGLNKHVLKRDMLDAKMRELEQTSPRDLWLKEMLDFERAYNRHYNPLKVVG